MRGSLYSGPGYVKPGCRFDGDSGCALQLAGMWEEGQELVQRQAVALDCLGLNLAGF